MRVMVLGLRGFPGVQGGVERHAEELYPRLAARGCQVSVIVRSPYVDANVARHAAVPMVRVWAPTANGIEAFVHTLLGVAYAAVARPDVLHIHAIGPAIWTPLARLLGLKVVVTHHGPDYRREKWGRIASWILRSGEALGMRFAHARIAVSATIAAEVWERHKQQALVIPNGVTLPELPQTADCLKQFGLEPGRYFLQVSRLVPEKRQLDLIRAFQQASIRGWKLVLVGGVDRSDEYTRLLLQQAHQDRGIVIAGFQSGMGLAELYAHAGGFVLPSSHEGLPIVLLEALSYGLPTIASGIPANREVPLPEDCYFHPGDVAELEQKLKRLAQTDPSSAERQARREAVRRSYDWETIARRTLGVYEGATRPQTFDS